MARIRTIKPEFPQSESMGRVSRDARLLYVMLWTICDDSGRARANSRMLASLLFPYDEDADAAIEGWLCELERENCILRYTHGAYSYVAVLNWTRHQKIDKPSKPRFPGPPVSPKPRERSARPREASSLDQGPRKGSRTGSRKGAGEPDLFESSLDKFWNLCPKKIAKGKTRAAFAAALELVSHETLSDAMARYAQSRIGQDETFTLHPATWLAQERWHDELPSVPATVAPHESWRAHGERLSAEVGKAVFASYFAPHIFDAGPPARLAVSSGVLRDLIERKYAGALARLFGPVAIEVRS